ncbi:hypothetical protein B0H17DRAFT_1285761 [Mycena rosella]|uniref:Uncharacterized protein n=1 Tax=Mycena rosella TaxID=1033263 RepID=A0AAD7BQK1_MYCRO|nr:hypothetical protein B0H17DRAFT_1285761 [Mycena rosella]
MPFERASSIPHGKRGRPPGRASAVTQARFAPRPHPSAQPDAPPGYQRRLPPRYRIKSLSPPPSSYDIYAADSFICALIGAPPRISPRLLAAPSTRPRAVYRASESTRRPSLLRRRTRTIHSVGRNAYGDGRWTWVGDVERPSRHRHSEILLRDVERLATLTPLTGGKEYMYPHPMINPSRVLLVLVHDTPSVALWIEVDHGLPPVLVGHCAAYASPTVLIESQRHAERVREEDETGVCPQYSPPAFTPSSSASYRRGLDAGVAYICVSAGRAPTQPVLVHAPRFRPPVRPRWGGWWRGGSASSYVSDAAWCWRRKRRLNGTGDDVVDVARGLATYRASPPLWGECHRLAGGTLERKSRANGDGVDRTHERWRHAWSRPYARPGVVSSSAPRQCGVVTLAVPTLRTRSTDFRGGRGDRGMGKWLGLGNHVWCGPGGDGTATRAPSLCVRH